MSQVGSEQASPLYPNQEHRRLEPKSVPHTRLLTKRALLRHPFGGGEAFAMPLPAQTFDPELIDQLLRLSLTNPHERDM